MKRFQNRDRFYKDWSERQNSCENDHVFLLLTVMFCLILGWNFCHGFLLAFRMMLP